jgi:hypothetical protein
MANRIRDVHVVNHRLDPHETELRIHVKLDQLTPATQIKGRLMGPRNVYASTVEVAYPLREVERGTHIVLRVVIPEPSWWEPMTPFLYEGPLELWQDGLHCERRVISHGINRVQLTSKGLQLNGKPIVLRGKAVESPLTDDEAKTLHDEGVNLILSPWSDALADIADRRGLFFLVRSQELPVRFLLQYASVLGWVVPAEWLGFIGETQDGRRSGGVFAYGPIDKMPNQHRGAKIVLARPIPDPLPTRPDVIGWIESP